MRRRTARAAALLIQHPRCEPDSQHHLQGIEEGLPGAGQLGGQFDQVGWLAAASEPFFEGVSAGLVADGAAEAEGVGDAALGGVDADLVVGAWNVDLGSAQVEGGAVEMVPGDRCGGGRGPADGPPPSEAIGRCARRSARPSGTTDSTPSRASSTALTTTSLSITES